MAKKVGRLLAEKVRGTRSPLYLWLFDNHAEIKPIIDKRPSWQALALTAKDAGIEGPDNGGPSRQAVRKAWKRVELDRAATDRPSSTVASTGSPVRPAALPPQGTKNERLGSPGPRFDFNNEATDDDVTRLTGVKPKPR